MTGVKNLSKRFGTTEIFDDFSISFPENAVSCLLGPSGCGKTTLLKLMAGLVIPEKGEVYAPRDLSFVFQEPRLLPWKTVLENAWYATDRRLTQHQRRDQAIRMLDLLELSDAGSLYPAQISGGMAGRVALARALLAPSQLLLLDEPMNSLDPDLRERISEKLKTLIVGKTVILVTHDYTIAAGFADRAFRFSSAPVEVQEVEKSKLRQTLNQLESGASTVEKS